MRLYHQSIYRKPLPSSALTDHAINTSVGIVGGANPDVVTQSGAYDIPERWKVGERVSISWSQINSGLRAYYARLNRR